jgi:DNA adenine methylase
MGKQSEFNTCLLSQIGGYRKKIHGEEFFSPSQKELFPGLKRDLNMEIEDAARSDDPLEACMERRGYKPTKTQVFQDAISAKLTADMFGKQEKLTGAEAMFQEQMQECLDKLKNRPKLKFGDSDWYLDMDKAIQAAWESGKTFRTMYLIIPHRPGDVIRRSIKKPGVAQSFIEIKPDGKVTRLDWTGATYKQTELKGKIQKKGQMTLFGKAELPQWKYSDYSNWSRLYAKDNTIPELEKELSKLEKEQERNTESHLRSLKKTTSMQSQSQYRAQARNVVTGNYERRRAIEDAIEIHKYYPENAKGSIKKITEKSGQMTLFGKIRKFGLSGDYDTREKLEKRFEIVEEVLGQHDGQMDLVKYVVDRKTGMIEAKVDFSLYKGKAYIDWIEVSEDLQKQGIGRQLIKELKAEYPKIQWGYTTPAGTALKKAVKRLGTFDIKTAPIWELNPSMYLSQQNIHEPWIAEIAPTQYARLSKRAKAEYDQKRHREWEASAKGKVEWKDFVWDAYKKGKFDLNTQNVSRETKDIIILKERERKQAKESFETQKIYTDWTRKTNVHFSRFDQLKPGDRVWDRFSRGYYKVIKVNPKSVRMETEELYKEFGRGELKPITITNKYVEHLTRLSPEDEKIEFEKYLNQQPTILVKQKIKKTIPEQSDFINPSQMTLFGRLQNSDSLPPILGWVGGKTKLAEKIISMMPEHKVYVEPFLGGGSVFFKKPLAGVNVINDLDKNLINFYKGVRDGNCEEIRACKLPQNKTAFNKAVEGMGENPCDYLGVNKRSYGSNMRWYGYLEHHSNAVNAKNKCEEYKDKLKQAKVLNKDYEDVVKEYDSKDMLCYIDPPYWIVKNHYGNGNGKIEPEGVANLVKSLKGKAIVSYNNHPRVRKAFAGLNFHKVKTVYSIQSGTKRNVSELLITNF